MEPAQNTISDVTYKRIRSISLYNPFITVGKTKMKSFTDIPEIKPRPRERSLEPFNPLEPTLLIYESLGLPLYRFSMKAVDGLVTSVWVNDEMEAKKILLDEEKIWRKGPQTYEPFASLVPLHLISLEADYHAKMRVKAQTALSDALSEGRIPAKIIGQKLISLVEHAIKTDEPTWMGKVGILNGEKVFVTECIDRMLRASALDIVSTALFGKAWNVLDDYTARNVKADSLAKLMHELHWRVADFNYREWRKNHRSGPAGELLDILDKFVLDEIEKSRERVQREEENTCMLDSWTRDASLTTEEVRNLAMTFLTMGSENVSTGLAWCAVCLSENSEMQEDAIKSKDALLDSFHEAIRLYPSVSVLTRMPLQDTVICGYHIPKFTEVVVNMYALHRNKKTWGENAELFLPKRCPVVSTQGPPDAFPFGGGSRSCIGRPLTMHELQNVLLPVFQRFKLHAVLPSKEIPTGVCEFSINMAARTSPNNFVSLRPGNHCIAFVPRTGAARL
jgi:hypothetical protein